MRGNFDLRDPETLPGVQAAMASAYQRVATESELALVKWERLAKRLKGKVTSNRSKARQWGDTSSSIQMTFPGGRISSQRDGVELHIAEDVPNLSYVERAAICAIFKEQKIDLYSVDFVTYCGNGRPYGDGSFNAIRIGYYNSLGGKNANRIVRAVLATVELFKSKAK